MRERPSQPEEAPPTAGSAEQGHGRRDVAGGEGCEVTERPARQAERAEQPPAEVQGIVAKLLAFVKVRLSPLVHLWMRAVLWSPGAQQGGCWRVLLATVMLKPIQRYLPHQHTPARPRYLSEVSLGRAVLEQKRYLASPAPMLQDIGWSQQKEQTCCGGGEYLWR